MSEEAATSVEIIEAEELVLTPETPESSETNDSLESSDVAESASSDEVVETLGTTRAEELVEDDALSLVPLLQALFLSSSEPLDLETLTQVCEVDSNCVNAAIKLLAAQLEDDKFGISLVAVAKGFQLRTKAQYGRFIRTLRQESPRKLSPAALETLAVVAYRQPVVKHDIDGIRGVDVMPTMKTLLDRGLVQVVGHRDTVGHPSLYGTTEEFLRVFGLNSLADLPTVNELNHMKEEPGEEAGEYENPLANIIKGDSEHVTASNV